MWVPLTVQLSAASVRRGTCVVHSALLQTALHSMPDTTLHNWPACHVHSDRITSFNVFKCRLCRRPCCS